MFAPKRNIKKCHYTYFLITSTDSEMDIPPMARQHRISGRPASCKQEVKCLMMSCVCFANSRDGQIISPRKKKHPVYASEDFNSQKTKSKK